MKKNIIAIFLLLICNPTFSASLEKAQLLVEHGLDSSAKTILIDVIFSDSSDIAKSVAYYELGNIAYKNNKVTSALKAWTTLASKYPSSKAAMLVKDRNQQLSEIRGGNAKENVDNAIAASYLKHADFWSSDRDNKFTIDASWIPKVEASTKWYDKVILEFPNTKAARIAYEEKLLTFFGWKERGKYGASYGLKKDFDTYMPQILTTFKELEKNYPDTPTLQALRFQIAQAYWSAKKWDKTKLWLHTIIEKSGETDSFYKDTAKRRLQKVEY
jgi:predicted negative regulator of RcsB-dependent stress response